MYAFKRFVTVLLTYQFVAHRTVHVQFNILELTLLKHQQPACYNLLDHVC